MIVELALVTGIPMSEWETRPTEDIATAIELIEERNRA